jgi:hypothetical protein
MKYIGIDPGKKTGFAVWEHDARYLAEVATLSITQAMEKVRMMADILGRENIRLYIEDARQRTWFGNSGPEKWKGAGSICRDCTIWEGFCREQGLEYRMMAPSAGCTKLGASQFKALTKWQGRTSNHARDAAMLVFGR